MKVSENSLFFIYFSSLLNKSLIIKLLRMKTERLNQLNSLLDSSPNDPFLLYAIAKEHEGMGDVASAMASYANLYTHHPDYVGAYYHYAKLLEKQEKYEEALGIYSKGMQVAKKIGDQHAHGELANAKLNLEYELD